MGGGGGVLALRIPRKRAFELNARPCCFSSDGRAAVAVISSRYWLGFSNSVAVVVSSNC